MKSYVVTRLSVPARINEAKNLYLNHTRNVVSNVTGLLGQARGADTHLKRLLGRPVSGLKMLEVGPGQQLVQMAYFGMHNEVVGIDRDSVIERLDLAGCARMVKENGWVRTCKTVARKMTGIDSLVKNEVKRQLQLSSLPKCSVLQMDAAKMDFPSAHFDVVFSRAVFEHLSDPGAVLAEIRRVLKPGGVMFISLHLFSSDSGCHDTRIFIGDRAELPFWSHLRPEHESEVRSNSYLNKLSLADWRRLFETEMPGSEVFAPCDAGDADRAELSRLRAEGKLKGYSDEELLTVTLEAGWRKPLEDDTNAKPETVHELLSTSPTA